MVNSEWGEGGLCRTAQCHHGEDASRQARRHLGSGCGLPPAAPLCSDELRHTRRVGRAYGCTASRSRHHIFSNGSTAGDSGQVDKCLLGVLEVVDGARYPARRKHSGTLRFPPGRPAASSLQCELLRGDTCAQPGLGATLHEAPARIRSRRRGRSILSRARIWRPDCIRRSWPSGEAYRSCRIRCPCGCRNPRSACARPPRRESLRRLPKQLRWIRRRSKLREHQLLGIRGTRIGNRCFGHAQSSFKHLPYLELRPGGVDLGALIGRDQQQRVGEGVRKPDGDCGSHRQNRTPLGDPGVRPAKLQNQCGQGSSVRGGTRPARIIDAPVKMVDVDQVVIDCNSMGCGYVG